MYMPNTVPQTHPNRAWYVAVQPSVQRNAVEPGARITVRFLVDARCTFSIRLVAFSLLGGTRPA
jgi:hypothetical protein